MVKLFLYPFSILYGFAIYLRNRLYDLRILKSTEFEVPVISIGNITVGGTGKTPHVEYLVYLLKDKFEVATLSRGYKRKSTGFFEVETNSSVEQVGDEPLQIKRKFPDVTVSVCENRVEGVMNLLDLKNEKTPDVVILDDAFQHRRITPGINILLIDYNRPVKEDKLLPAGRLRERISQMRRANIIVITKCPEEVTPIMQRIMQKNVNLKPYQELFFTKLKYGNLQPVFDAPDINPAFFEKKQHSVLLVTGIASPELIQKYLANTVDKIESLIFPDHHNYTETDTEKIQKEFNSIPTAKKIIVTTEKDAVRFKELSNLDETIKKGLYFLPVSIDFLGKDEKTFTKRILNYVGENKSNRNLHKRKNTGKP